MDKIKKVIKAVIPVAALAVPFLAFGALPPVVIPGDAPVTVTKVLSIIQDVLDYLVVFGVVIGAIFVIYGGLVYMTARGDSKRADEAKLHIKHGFIGIVVVVGVYAIIATANYLVGSFQSGGI